MGSPHRPPQPVMTVCLVRALAGALALGHCRHGWAALGSEVKEAVGSIYYKQKVRGHTSRIGLLGLARVLLLFGHRVEGKGQQTLVTHEGHKPLVHSVLLVVRPSDRFRRRGREGDGRTGCD